MMPSVSPLAARWQQEGVWLTIVLLFSLVIRLVAITTVPSNVTADEADNLQVAYHILAGTGPGFWGLDWKPAPAFSVHLIAASLRMFGSNIAAMRLPSVILSAAALVPLYVLARRGGVSPLAALLSCTLMSASYWYLNFSRSGWENIHIGLYALGAALCTSLGLERGRWHYYAAAGVFASLGLYGYFTGRLIIVALVLYLSLWALWKRKLPKETLKGYFILLSVCFVLFAPQMKTIVAEWNDFNRRTYSIFVFNPGAVYREEAVSNVELLGRQISRTFSGVILMDSGVSQYGLNGRYVPKGHGFLDPATTFLFWLGLLIGVFKGRSTGIWWCLLVVLLLPVQVLSTGTPDGARAVGAAPFFFLFVALGIHKLISFPGRRGQVMQAMGVVGVLAIVYYNISIYSWWMEQPETAKARQPAVEVEEFDRWQSLQMQEASAGRWGFTVDQWHELRRQLQ